MTMRILRRASERAFLVETEDLDAAMRLHAALAAAALPGVTELIPAARTVLVRFEPHRIRAADLAALIRDLDAPPVAATHGAVVEIPVHYDGEDLADVAGHLGMSADAVIAAHLAMPWRVAFTGFAPGFGYLTGDGSLAVPRRSSPRTRIPAGSVALAGPFSGVYPRASPGGWQLIGRTDLSMWDLTRDPPALLRPGVAVRFARAEREAVRIPVAVTAPIPDARAVEVLSPGAQLLVQDDGRPGHADLGVGRSGAADRGAMRRANRAVGNDPSAAVLEQAGGGAVLRFHTDGVIAVTGAEASHALARADGSEEQVRRGVPVAVWPGDELHLGHPTAGLRTVVAVRGGIAAAPVLGSRATDTLAGLGPAPVRSGDRIPLGALSGGGAAVQPDPLPEPPLPRPGDDVTLRVTLGPRDDRFTAEALSDFQTQTWIVTPASDRVGMRLAGPPLAWATPDELPSEGVVAGSLQVPPDGQPVLFLTDHPLTGGYPVIAVVHADDLDLAAQLSPGVHLRFRIETLD